MIGLTVIRHDVTDSSRGWHGHGSSMASGKLIDSGLDIQRSSLFSSASLDATEELRLLISSCWEGSGRHDWLS